MSDFNAYTTEAAALNGYFLSDCNLDKSVTVSDFNLFLGSSGLIGVEGVRY